MQRLRKINQEEAVKSHITESVKVNITKSNKGSDNVYTNFKHVHSDTGKQGGNNIVSLDKFLIQPVQNVGSYFVDKSNVNDVK